MIELEEYLRGFVEVQKRFAAVGVTSSKVNHALAMTTKFFDIRLYGPESFTPDEFNRMWDGFSKDRRVQYVLYLIYE